MENKQSTINPESKTAGKVVHPKIILALLCVAQFMLVLDASIVTIALPSIGRALGLSQTGLSWVLNIYVIIFGGFLLLGGRIGDLFGRRRIFMVGLSIFTLSSLLGGLSQTGWMLIGARAIQGFAAALVAPSVLSLITTTFTEGPKRNWALSIYGAVSASGFIVGVLLGGILTELLSWHWVLFVNVPLGIIITILAPLLLEESHNRIKRSLDFPGALSITAGMMALAFGLTQAEHMSWKSWPIISAFTGGVLLILLFVFIESRSQTPLVRLGIFRNRKLTGGNLVGGIFFGLTNAPLTFILALYMQNVLGYSPLKTGLAFLPLGMVVIVIASQISKVVNRVGVRWCLATGAGIMATGYAWLASGLSTHSSYANVLLPGTIIVGIGGAFIIVAGSISATTGVSDNEQGLASGLFNTSRRIGTSLGIAIFITAATAGKAALGGGETVLVGGYRLAIYIGLGFTILACLAAILVIPTNEYEIRTVENA